MDFIARLWGYTQRPLIHKLIIAAFVSVSGLLFLAKAITSRYIINPDGVLYLSIARQYAEGHFSSALNGLVSPMISWLMAPLIKIGLDPQLAFMAVNVAAALLILITGIYLVRWKTKNNLVASLLYGAVSVPFLIFAIGYSVTPDLLVVLWVVLFLAVALKAEEWLRAGTLRRDLLAGGLLGLVGVMGYFTKMFLVPFWLASLGLWFLTRMVAQRRQIKKLLSASTFNRFLRVPVIALAVMLLLAAPWVMLLSAKYDRFMPGLFITQSQSIALGDSSQSPAQSTSPDPAETKPSPRPRLRALPNPHATTYIEGSGLTFTFGRSYQSQSLAGYFSQQARALPHNLERVAFIWWGTLPILILLIWAFLARKISYQRQPHLFLGGLWLLIYFGGYAAILESRYTSLNRYYWPTLILAALIAGWGLPLVWLKFRQSSAKRLILILVLISLPVGSLLRYKAQIPLTFRTPPKPALQQLAEDLQQEGIIQPGHKLASNNRRQTDFMAFYTRAQSFGSISAERSDLPEFAEPAVQKALAKYKIDYYLHFTSPKDSPLNLTNTGAKVIKVIRLSKLACENYRGASPTPCTISVVQLPSPDKNY